MDETDQLPPGQNAVSVPIAAWQGLPSNQSMNWTNRRTPLPLLVAAQSFVFPGVAAIEEAPAPDVPVEPNMVMRGFLVFAFRELVRNKDSIVEAAQQFISWIRDMLQF